MSHTSSEGLLDIHGAAIVSLAQHLFAKGSGGIERAELVSHGVAGMLEAARRYDPESGAQFWTFAYSRVHGAMLDAIRGVMPLPNQPYRRRKKAEADCRATVAGTPEHAEANRRLVAQTEATARLSAGALAIALGEALGVDEDADPETDDPAARVFRLDAEGADERLERAELAAALRAALRELSLEERMILRGLYFEERGLLEIGAELGLSKSWASRIHTRALGRLKKRLAKSWGFEAVGATGASESARGDGMTERVASAA